MLLSVGHIGLPAGWRRQCCHHVLHQRDVPPVNVNNAQSHSDCRHAPSIKKTTEVFDAVPRSQALKPYAVPGTGGCDRTMAESLIAAGWPDGTTL